MEFNNSVDKLVKKLEKELSLEHKRLESCNERIDFIDSKIVEFNNRKESLLKKSGEYSENIDSINEKIESLKSLK